MAAISAMAAQIGAMWTRLRDYRNSDAREERKREQFLRDPDARRPTFMESMFGRYRRWKRNKSIQKRREESRNFQIAKPPPDRLEHIKEVKKMHEEAKDFEVASLPPDGQFK